LAVNWAIVFEASTAILTRFYIEMKKIRIKISNYNDRTQISESSQSDVHYTQWHNITFSCVDCAARELYLNTHSKRDKHNSTVH